jgi:hypothetical protein
MPVYSTGRARHKKIRLRCSCCTSTLLGRCKLTAISLPTVLQVIGPCSCQCLARLLSIASQPAHHIILTPRCSLWFMLRLLS